VFLQSHLQLELHTRRYLYFNKSVSHTRPYTTAWHRIRVDLTVTHGYGHAGSYTTFDPLESYHIRQSTIDKLTTLSISTLIHDLYEIYKSHSVFGACFYPLGEDQDKTINLHRYQSATPAHLYKTRQSTQSQRSARIFRVFTPTLCFLPGRLAIILPKISLRSSALWLADT